jgi:hypothetical protein
VSDNQNVTDQQQTVKINKSILHILSGLTTHLNQQMLLIPYQCNHIVIKYKVIRSNNFLKIRMENAQVNVQIEIVVIRK